MTTARGLRHCLGDGPCVVRVAVVQESLAPIGRHATARGGGQY
jgi:hypothetical protein